MNIFPHWHIEAFKFYNFTTEFKLDYTGMLGYLKHKNIPNYEILQSGIILNGKEQKSETIANLRLLPAPE